MTCFSAQVEVFIQQNINISSTLEQSWFSYNSQSNSEKIDIKIDNQLWRYSSIFLKDEGIFIEDEIYSILEISEINVIYNKYMDNEYSKIGFTDTNTVNSVINTKNSNIGNNMGLLNIINKKPTNNNIYNVAHIKLNRGNKFSTKSFRYEIDNKNAILYVKVLQNLFNFLTSCREIFTDLKKSVIKAEITRNHFKVLLESNTSAEIKPSDNEINLLKIGYGLQELSLLEEALAYCPLSSCLFLKDLKNLNKIPFEGHRSRLNILSLRSLYDSFYKDDENNKKTKRHSAGLKLFGLNGAQWKESKAVGRCEDATFVSNEDCALGVFDGVGSWALEGIDASKFSLGMAEMCLKVIKDDSINSIIQSDSTVISQRAINLLKLSHDLLAKNMPDAWGSSTAVVALLDKYTGRLGVACLGDSVLMILRRGTVLSSPVPLGKIMGKINPSNADLSEKINLDLINKPKYKTRNVVYRTKEQRWENGAPYQLANLPCPWEWPKLKEQGLHRFYDILHCVDIKGDSPDRACAEYIECQPGDLILLMTDGVSDNLFDDEISTLCSFVIDPEEALCMGNPLLITPPEDIARMITNAAMRRSCDNAFSSPFVRAASKMYDKANNSKFTMAKDLRGGKRDDISCVASWVYCETEESVKAIYEAQAQKLKEEEIKTAEIIDNTSQSNKIDTAEKKNLIQETSTPKSSNLPIFSVKTRDLKSVNKTSLLINKPKSYPTNNLLMTPTKKYDLQKLNKKKSIILEDRPVVTTPVTKQKVKIYQFNYLDEKNNSDFIPSPNNAGMTPRKTLKITNQKNHQIK